MLGSYKLTIDVKMTIHIAGKKYTHNSSTGYAEKSNFYQVESSP
jgi:hypothetical protein